MKRPNRKDYINKATKIQLIADQELCLDYLEAEIKQLRIGGVSQQRELLVCPNNEQHIVKKEGDGKYCMVCGILK